MTSPRSLRWTIASLAVTLLAAGTAPPAHASLPTGASVMVILDASGSMQTDDAPGPRITAAKTAVVGLVRSLPSTARVGLTVYGTGTGSAAADKPAGCRDIHTLVPVQPLDRSKLIAAVGAVRARGYTPIGRALQQAAAGLPRRGPASIVLVSDGEDTCAPPPPCAVAAALARAHPDLVIHTIGFRVGRTARAQLECIARATGGTYRDAQNGPRLGAQLRGQVDAGLRPYVVSGTPISGSATPGGAPLLTPGQFTDTFAAGGPVTKYYSVELTAPETVYVGTTIVPPALRGGGTTSRLALATRLLNSAGDRCQSTERENDTLLAGKVDPVTAVIGAAVGGPDWSKRCARSGRFVVEVTRASTSSTPTRSETFVVVEPAVATVPLPVQTVPSGLGAPPVAAGGRACVGGTSFGTAPQLTAGTCTDSLATGETRYYRVHVGWGQRLTYQIVVDKVAGADHGNGYVRSALATPLRQLLTLSSASNAARDFGGPVSIDVHGSTLVPVEYGNRASTRSDIRGYSLAGDYYLSLGMTYPSAAAPYRTGVRIAVALSGSVQPGPRYLTLPGVARTSASATPAPASTTLHATGQRGRSTSWVWWILLGGVLLGAAAIAAVLRARRRSPSRW